MHSEGLEAVGEDVTSNSTYDVKAVNISNETRSSGSDHSSSVVGTATGSLPIDEQCVELHLTYPTNQRPSRCRNFLYELKVLFHLSWPICLSSFLEQTLFQLVVSIFCGHASLQGERRPLKTASAVLTPVYFMRLSIIEDCLSIIILNFISGRGKLWDNVDRSLNESAIIKPFTLLSNM